MVVGYGEGVAIEVERGSERDGEKRLREIERERKERGETARDGERGRGKR